MSKTAAKVLAFAMIVTLGGSNTVNARIYSDTNKDEAFVSYVSKRSDGHNLYICGTPIGIKLYCSGALVVDVQEIETPDGVSCPAKQAGIKKGDLIKKIDGKDINGNNDLISIISKSRGEQLDVVYERDGAEKNGKITPVKTSESGDYKIGVWVRDSCAGIVTVTYYNEYDHSFAALGHGICDVDTGSLVRINDGIPADICIDSVQKSSNGSIGCLVGHFKNDINDSYIKANTSGGIYGYMSQPPEYARPIEIADRNEIKCGDAEILTTVDGETPKCYDVKIEALNLSNDECKNFIIRITDKELLEKTGGIVQGMSGSPIIQNGKLIGAVTHVFVNYPTKGYAIFIDNMLNLSDSLSNAA